MIMLESTHIELIDKEKSLTEYWQSLAGRRQKIIDKLNGENADLTAKNARLLKLLGNFADSGADTANAPEIADSDEVLAIKADLKRNSDDMRLILEYQPVRMNDHKRKSREIGRLTDERAVLQDKLQQAKGQTSVEVAAAVETPAVPVPAEVA